MGRPEKPIDPGGGELARFAADLRILRDKAGITYRVMSRRVHYSVTSLAAAAAGDELPTLAVTLAYVEACDGDTTEWERRWRALATESSPAKSATPAGVPAPGFARQATPGARQRSRLRPPVVLGGGALILAAVVAAAVTLAAHSPRSAPHLPMPSGLSPSLVAGLGCANTPQHNFSDYDAPGTYGWHHVGGGWSGNGCTGIAEFTRITGLRDQWAQTADWVFQTPAARHCTLAIYIPNAAEADGVAQYDLYNSTDTTYDSRLTTISIDQAPHHGQWVAAGRYVFARPVVDLEITDRGTGHATIALSTVRLTCT